MRTYKCAHCSQLVYFENTYCEKCGHPFGFEKDNLSLITLNAVENNLFSKYNQPESKYKYCANHLYNVCNWLIPASSPDIYCPACELNQTIPDISTATNIAYWQKIENAKHRLIYSLYRLQLPPISKVKDAVHGLAFNFLGSTILQPQVLTGHEEGLITINIEEADDVKREQVRRQMGEPYRTLLGHFRHEVGHYYWDLLILSGNRVNEFRQMFGDERDDYAKALQNHYYKGGLVNWQQNHISQYASAHPWEDWAETWAHYLHMMDTLETAWSFGLHVAPINLHPSSDLAISIDTDPYLIQDFDHVIKHWLPFTYAMNSINRSMGYTDLYPFVTSTMVHKKLAFIHDTCRKAAHQQPMQAETMQYKRAPHAMLT